MSRNMTLAIERIADDPRFAERFRTDPPRALRRYRLTSGEIEAIKAGDVASLQAHDVDVVAFTDGKRHGVRRFWRKALVALGTVGVALSMSAAPATAGRARFLHGVEKASLRQARLGRAIRVNNVLLTRASMRRALRQNGVFVRAQGRTALRRYLDIGCNKLCLIDVGDGEPLVLAD